MSHPPEMAVEGGEPPVELLTQVADQRGVVRDRRLPPAVGDRLEQRNQRRRRGDDHILAERGLEQLRTLAESCGEELIARQEQHRELGAALELRPVLLGGELAHPRLDLLRVAPERLAALLLALRLEGGEKGLERRLGVDHEIARVGHVHDEIGTERACLAHHPQLLGEVAVLGEAGELDQAAKRQLAPAAAHLGTAERGGEVARLALQLRLAAGERLDLGAESRKGLAALALEGLHLRLGALERGAQRLHQLLDGELALPERAGSHGLVASQRLAREAQEELAVRAQRLSRERVERGAQPRLGFLEELQAIGFIEGARLESHARGGELDPQRLDAARGAQLHHQGTEHRAGGERGRGDQENGERRHRPKCAR